jgi:hypothetical protein
MRRSDSYHDINFTFIFDKDIQNGTNWREKYESAAKGRSTATQPLQHFDIRGDVVQGMDRGEQINLLLVGNFRNLGLFHPFVRDEILATLRMPERCVYM